MPDSRRFWIGNPEKRETLVAFALVESLNARLSVAFAWKCVGSSSSLEMRDSR